VQLIQAYEKRGIARVLVIYNLSARLSSNSNDVAPVSMSAHTTAEAEPAEAFDYLYEPSPTQVSIACCVGEVEVQLFQIFLRVFRR